MSLIRNLLRKKDEPIKSYADFWNWFAKNEKAFFNAVKSGKRIEKDFFEQLTPKLAELKDGFFFLTGMYNDTTVELVLTADGTVKNIVFVEELVQAAPTLTGWKFTALKPALDIKDVSISMGGYTFNEDNLRFYSTEHPEYPDEIDITLVHPDYTEENKAAITNGCYIFLDNYLGELDFATTIDNLTVIGKDKAKKELVPVEKLKAFLTWRQKEFIEKYEGVRHDTEKDNYAGLEAELENGNALVAMINTDLLQWDGKASHPWIVTVEIKYDGSQNKGMPSDDTYQWLEVLEEKLMEELKDFEGYLNVGRQTADGSREIYFACKEFRKPSKVLHQLQRDYTGTADVGYDIYFDKYWRSFNRFNAS